MTARLRQSRRPVPSSMDKGSGTWTKVLYILGRRAAHYHRRALHTKNLKMVRRYRVHAEVCDSIVAKLDHELRFQSFVEKWENGASNTGLSAPLLPSAVTTEGETL